MPEVRIQELVALDREPDRNGHRPIANFRCQVHGINLHGVTLLMHRTGFMMLGNATAKRGFGLVGAILVDHELECDVIRAAHTFAEKHNRGLPPLILPKPRPYHSKADGSIDLADEPADDSGLVRTIGRHAVG